jgi:two-component system chemotaxis response regulator CheY
MLEINTKTEVPLSTRILVVDDSKTMMDQMLAILKNLGFSDVSTAKEGAVAWNIILKENDTQRPFGLILCDWNMPGHLSGIQLLEKVRTTEALKSTLFILVTTENSFEKVKKAMDLGVSNYIIKPYAPADVSQKLNSTWKKRKQKAGS